MIENDLSEHAPSRPKLGMPKAYCLVSGVSKQFCSLPPPLVRWLVDAHLRINNQSYRRNSWSLFLPFYARLNFMSFESKLTA